MTPCTHGAYYDCEHGCTPAHLLGDEAAIRAATMHRDLRFNLNLTPEAACEAVARELGATRDEVGPLIGRGVGIMGARRD